MDTASGVREKAEEGQSQRGGRETAGSEEAEKRGPAAPTRLRDGCSETEPRACRARATRRPLGQRPFQTLLFINYAISEHIYYNFSFALE